jgi:hypothetical protein
MKLYNYTESHPRRFIVSFYWLTDDNVFIDENIWGMCLIHLKTCIELLFS